MSFKLFLARFNNEQGGVQTSLILTNEQLFYLFDFEEGAWKLGMPHDDVAHRFYAFPFKPIATFGDIAEAWIQSKAFAEAYHKLVKPKPGQGMSLNHDAALAAYEKRLRNLGFDPSKVQLTAFLKDRIAGKHSP